MAATKVLSTIFNSVTLTAGAASTTSSSVDLLTKYGSALYIKITNGATGPTVAAECQIEVSPDDTNWYRHGGPLVAGVTNTASYSWGCIDLPIGTGYVRLVAGANTGQDVTILAQILQVTAVA